MTKGTGCTIYESQSIERYCRLCRDAQCLERWKKVEFAFPLNTEISLHDSNGIVYITRAESDKRPIQVRWHKPQTNGWDRTTFLLYWKSLDQDRPYCDPSGRTQAERVATLVGNSANI